MVWFQDKILAKIDKDFLDRVLAKWGVGKVSFFKAVSGWQNLGIYVKLKKQELLLRFFRPRKRIKEKIYLELELANYLKEKGLPTPKVYLTKEGEMLVFERIARFNIPIALMDFLPGSPKFHFSDREIVEAASLLARLHQALKGFSSSHRAVRWYPFFDLVMVDKGIRKLEKRNSMVARLFNKDYQLLFKIFTEYKTLLSPKTLIHGDFHFGNLLFSEFQISGLLDFDQAKFASPIWDLAIFLGNAKNQFWEHQGKNVPVKKLQGLILDGYQSKAKLKEEILLFSPLVRLFFWQKVLWAKKEIEAGNLWARQIFDLSIAALKEKF